VYGLRRGDQDVAIAEFWEWWAESRLDVAAAFANNDVEEWSEGIHERIKAIDGGLEWALERGVRSRFALVLSRAGTGKLRPIVARWLDAAIPPDEDWEYLGARPSSLDTLTRTMHVPGGHVLELVELEFGFTVNRSRAHVVAEVYHPQFENLAYEDQWRISLAVLTFMLGEDNFETWIGPIQPRIDPPDKPVTPAELIAAVEALAKRHRKPRWTAIKVTRPDGVRGTAMAQRPLRPIRWPCFDTHVAIHLDYVVGDDGQPTSASLDQIHAAEKDLTALLGPDGALLAHETHGGSRILHYYVDGSTVVAVPLRERATELRYRVDEVYDPELEHVQHLS
jgi:hypothetical protein